MSVLNEYSGRSLGDFLRQRRKEEGLPLRKVAAMLDLDPSTLGKVEKNTRRLSEEMLPKLAEIFSADTRELAIMYHSDLIQASIGKLEYSIQILEATMQKLRTTKK